MKTRHNLPTAVALAGLLAGSLASAQNPGAQPTYGTLNLSAGFTPDPRRVEVRAGGDIQTQLGGCSSFVANAPDIDLNYRAGSIPLTIAAASDADVLLLINTPSGRWICDDDSGDGTNARITFSSPESGNYNIWVGTLVDRSGSLPAAQVSITELAGGGGSSAMVGEGGGSGVLNWRATPTYGTVTLRAGFTPDPVVRMIRAGGPDQVPDLGPGCSGYVTGRAPDYDLNYTAGSSPLNIYAVSDVDITLVINLPDGSWRCSDDEHGTNPMVSLPSPRTGNYNIWVGTFSAQSGNLPTARLSISEIPPRW